MLLQKVGEKLIYNATEYVVGEKIVATGESEYDGLVGYITEIRDGDDKETENRTPDIYCRFEPPSHPYDVEQLEETFSGLYDERKNLEDITLDMVIMAPEMIEPVRDLDERYRHKLPIFLLVERWTYDCDSGTNTWQFTNYSDARRALNERLSKEMQTGAIFDRMDSDAFHADHSEDSYECWVEGTYMNSYSICIEKDVLVMDPVAIGKIGCLWQKRCSFADFSDQVECLEDMSKLSEEDKIRFLTDERIQDRIDKKLGRNDAYWEAYWESVSEAARELLDEHPKMKSEV